MNMRDIAKKVRATVIQTKKALFGARSGDFRTRLNGSGYDFDQLREYQQGDDVRFIDWKGTARANKTLVREYKDERSRTMHLVLDVSSSMRSGAKTERNHEVMLQVAAAFITMGEATDDAIGMHFLHDKLEKTISPKPGKKHGAGLIAELMRQQRTPGNKQKKTALADTLREFGARHRQRSLLFIISDFIDEGYETPLRVLAQRHEVAVIRVRDKSEESLIAVSQGIEFEDPETGALFSPGLTDNPKKLMSSLREWRSEQDQLFKRLHIPCCDCFAGDDHIEQLLVFLRRYFG